MGKLALQTSSESDANYIIETVKDGIKCIKPF